MRTAKLVCVALVAFAVAAVGCALSPFAAAGVSARAARSLSLSEVGRLKMTSHKGFYFSFSGQASGSVSGTLYLHLHVLGLNRFKTEMSVYPSGSSMTGVASGTYTNRGSTANFSGAMSIVRGTGKYAHAYGTGLAFTGTLNRSNDSVIVHLNGKLTY